MFYIFFLLSFFIIISIYLVLKFVVFKNNDNFKLVIDKILKVLSVVYCFIIFLSILLPDAFSVSYDESYIPNSKNIIFAFVRWANYVPFVVIPISVFCKNKYIKNIAIYFCFLLTIVNLICFPTFLEFATSSLGKGLNSIPVISQGVKDFLLNPIFRSIVFAITWIIPLILSIILFFEDFKNIKLNNIKEFFLNLLIFMAIFFAVIPIFVPQHLFGYSNILLKPWSLPHILWLLFVVIELTTLYLMFRNKDEEIKYIVCLILSFALFLQYNEMFSAVSINIERLPLQLCNIGAYLILASIIFRNQKLFNFSVIVNLTGAVFALAVPDLEGKGLFYLWNMHFILEHTNIIIIPILALCFKLFNKIDKNALKDCLAGFSCYFLIVLILGTSFNAIALKTNNNFYHANYLFMFDAVKAEKVIKGIKALFDIKFKIGSFIVFYPVVQLLIYVVFIFACVLVYLLIKFVYFVINLINKKRMTNSKEIS